MRFSIGRTPKGIAQHRQAVAKESAKLREKEARKQIRRENQSQVTSPGYRVELSPEEQAAAQSGLALAEAKVLAADVNSVIFQYMKARAGEVNVGITDVDMGTPDALADGDVFDWVATFTNGGSLRLACEYLGARRVQLGLPDEAPVVLRMDSSEDMAQALIGKYA